MRISYIRFIFILSCDTTQIKEKLKNFQSLKAGTAEFIPALKSLIDALASCINEEEMADLPALDKSLSIEQSNSLESSFRRIKSVAPSRSHLVVPNTPLLETVAWMLAAPFDQLGDLFRRFPDEISPDLREFKVKE
jgi:hypothetical protein